MKTLTLHGAHIHDIPSFYVEVNAVFMADEAWQLGQSLDAFNDLLYGGFGALAGNEPVTLVWLDAEHSRKALGLEATRRYYQDKLSQPARFNRAHFQRQLDALENGSGQTYFDILLEIIADHPNITLVKR
ncbi:ribonuclease inhibitor [Enterobacteriaceae bacterium 4M9]|nr:ribonuclease inhibitor [Enterobacteriaceae bacterium 4M9]